MAVTPHFDCLIKRIPAVEVSWKSINMDLRFNKTCSFEVTLWLLPLILILSSKESLLYKSHENLSTWIWYLTKHAVLKLVCGCYPSFWSSHQKNPCYRSLMKIYQNRAKIFNKKCSFEVSIWLLPLILIVSSKESLL